MKLTGRQISSLLQKKEGERVEFKRAAAALPANLWDSYSAFCNTAIFNIFALVDIGERSGMGLANLHGLWKKYGYAEPKITESYDPDRTVITVTTDDDTVSAAVNDTVSGVEPDQNPTGTRPEILRELPYSCRQVFESIVADNKITYRAMVSKLSLNKDTVNTAVGTLIKHGLLRRVGPKKGGYWEIVK